MSDSQEPTDSLDRPADVASLMRLRQQGLLTDEAFAAARSLLLPRQVWREWVSRHLLFLGAALVLSGILFFFAYNWEDLGRLGRLGLAASGVLLCVAGSELVGRSKLGGKVLVLAASVLVGILLAVFGQAYQTGADAYELFVGWAQLIFLWVLISEFAALWCVWLVIVHCAAIFYWEQVGTYGESVPYDVWFLTLACVDVLALALREVALRRYDREWLAGVWFQACLITAALFFSSMPALAWLFGANERLPLGVGSLLLWLAVVASGFYFYRYVVREVLPLTLILVDVCVLLCCFAIHGIFKNQSWSDASPFLVSGLIILGVVGGAAVVLKSLITAMRNERECAAGKGEAI